MRALRLRAVVAVSAVSVAGGLLAGCSSSDGDDGAGAAAHGDGTVNKVAGTSEGPSAAPSALADGMGSDTDTDGVALPGLVWASRAARPLGLDPDTAAALGLRVDRARLGLTALGVVLAAAATGAAGPVGFVALTAPQLARRLTRTPQLPLVCSALTGAVVLVAADLVARTLVPPLEIPVGALTSLVGGPYLLWLLGRRQRR